MSRAYSFTQRLSAKKMSKMQKDSSENIPTTEKLLSFHQTKLIVKCTVYHSGEGEGCDREEGVGGGLSQPEDEALLLPLLPHPGPTPGGL